MPRVTEVTPAVEMSGMNLVKVMEATVGEEAEWAPATAPEEAEGAVRLHDMLNTTCHIISDFYSALPNKCAPLGAISIVTNKTRVVDTCHDVRIILYIFNICFLLLFFVKKE